MISVTFDTNALNIVLVPRKVVKVHAAYILNIGLFKQ